MTPVRPQVSKEGWYSRLQTAEALGVSPATLDNYSKAGFISYQLNRYNMRKRYSGLEIIKCWEGMIIGKINTKK